MERLKLATAWLGGCSGCHMSLLDLDEFLIELAGLVQVAYSPIADVKEYPEGVDLCLVEGAVCNDDNLELARRIRARTRWVAAFGDCAVTGNVPAIRNQLGPGNREQVLLRAAPDAAQQNRRPPAPDGILPRLLDRVHPLREVIAVDAYLPGCPPGPDRIRAALAAFLEGRMPKLGPGQLTFG